MNLLQNLINLDYLSKLKNINSVSIENLPCVIVVKDKKGAYIDCNEMTAQIVGLNKPENLFKLTDYDLSWSQDAPRLRHNDKKIIATNTAKIFHEQAHDFNHNLLKAISLKSPYKNKTNKVIGIIALSIIQTDYLNTQRNCFNILTSREKDCLYYLLQGKTAQGIADTLFISKRTAEKHLSNIKEKLDCKSKSALIELAIQNRFINTFASFKK